MGWRYRRTLTTIGLPGSGISYSRRTGEGSALLPGMLIAGLLALVIAAIRGSRPARAALIVIGIGLVALWLDNSRRSNTIATTAPMQWAAKSPPVPLALPLSTQLPPTSSISTGLMQEAIASPASAAVAAPSAENLVVTTTGANVRAAPSLSAKVLRQLSAGRELSVVRAEGSWAIVRDQNASGAALGWVHRSLLKQR